LNKFVGKIITNCGFVFSFENIVDIALNEARFPNTKVPNNENLRMAGVERKDSERRGKNLQQILNHFAAFVTFSHC
jgi:hypothetical protein